MWDGLSDARIEFASPLLPSTPGGGAPPSSSSPPDTPDDAWDAAFASALRPRRAHMSTMLENLNLQRAALRRIDECVRERGARVELLEGKRVEGIDKGEGGWPVVTVRGKGETGAGRKLRARLLVRSRLVVSLSFGSISLSYDTRRLAQTGPTRPSRRSPRSTRSGGRTTARASSRRWLSTRRCRARA